MRKLMGFALGVVFALFLAVPALASAPVHASVGSFFLRPGKLTIKKGTKVTWTWAATQGIAHNVSVKSGPAKFRSKTQAKGTFSYVFKKKGTYHLYCTIHPFMTETVVVK